MPKDLLVPTLALTTVAVAVAAGWFMVTRKLVALDRSRTERHELESLSTPSLEAHVRELAGALPTPGAGELARARRYEELAALCGPDAPRLRACLEVLRERRVAAP